MEKYSYSDIRKKLLKKEISCQELVEAYSKKLDENKSLNAFITYYTQKASHRAKQIDEMIRDNKFGKLTGLIIAIKDNINIKNEKASCGSKILSTYTSPFNATVINKLEAAGAIFIGKTNMDEFAMGSSTENSYFGVVKNPYNTMKVPGGSSGGSAVAVASNQCMAALGSDTGGSIRQPAAFCGLYGLKPTYGRVSRFGLIAYGSSLDQIGPFTKNAEDSARILEVIAGFDERDSTSAQIPIPDYLNTLKNDVKGSVIGIPKEYYGDGLAPEIREAIEAKLSLLEKAGAEIEEITLPHTEYAIADYYIIATAEASSNLERFDGVKYGFRAEDVKDLEDMYVQTRSQGFGNEVKRRIMLGAYVLSAGYYDAYYRKAQKVRTLISQDFKNAFKKCDCIITPTTPTTAFNRGEKTGDPLQMYLSDIYTVPINLAGLPGMSVPCGFDRTQMPIALQLISKPFDEEKIFQIAYFLNQHN